MRGGGLAATQAGKHMHKQSVKEREKEAVFSSRPPDAASGADGCAAPQCMRDKAQLFGCQ